MRRRNVSFAAIILGIALASVPAASFAVSPEWSPPVIVSDPLENAGAQQIVAAPDGTLTAVWINYVGINTVIQSSSSTDDGATWSAPVDISVPSTGSGSLDVAVASDGRVIVVWEEFDGAKYRVWASFSDDGGDVWAAPVALSPSGVDSNHAQIAITASGAAVATWQQLAGIAAKVWSSTSANGGVTWGAPSLRSDPLDSAYNPDVATRGSVVVIAWAGYVTGVLTTQTATSTDDGATWSTFVSVPGTGFDAQSQKVAIDSTGLTTVVWATYDGSNSVIQASSSGDTGASWSTAATLSESGVNSFSPIGLVADTSTTAVWLALDGTYSIASASLPSGGGSWSELVTLSPVGFSAFSPDIAVGGPNGARTVVWHQSDGFTFAIGSTSSSDGGLSWTTPGTVQPDDEEGFSARAAIAPSGLKVVIWSLNGDGGSFLEAATAQPAGVPALAATGAPLLPQLPVVLAAAILLAVGVLTTARIRIREAATK